MFNALGLTAPNNALCISRALATDLPFPTQLGSHALQSRIDLPQFCDLSSGLSLSGSDNGAAYYITIPPAQDA